MFWSDSIYLDSIIDDYRIGSTKIGRGLVGAGGELGLRPRGLRCALAARAARSRRMLAACARSQLLFCTAKNIWIHTKNIWLHTLYEFIFVWIHTFKVQKHIWIHTEFIVYMNSYVVWVHTFHRTRKKSPRELIDHNTCATTTPLHCLDKAIFLYLSYYKWKNDVTKQIRLNNPKLANI